MPRDAQPKVAANYHCTCGENPLWDDREGLLYWTDIDRGRLFRYRPSDGTHEPFYSGAPVGGFTLQEDGRLLAFRVNDIALVDRDGGVEVLREFADDGMVRFNDVLADPEGRVYAGTIGETADAGGVYRVDRDRTVTCLFKGTHTSNGMGFSPDLATFYWTDTTGRRIFAFDYDRAGGGLTNRRVVVSPGEDGGPDGMAVDTDGNIWCARWGGFGLFKYSAGGALLETIRFPVAKTSSLTLAGDDFATFFVTTAGGSEGDPDGALEGALFTMPAPARGRPEFRSRIA